MPDPDPPAVEATAAPPPMPQIGQPCDPMTPGWLMGLGKAPESNAAHNARLGASAKTYRDVGWLMGSMVPRPGWPAKPMKPCPTAAADWSTHQADLAWLTAHAEDFSDCTSLESAWSRVRGLTSFPLINTGSCRDFGYAWIGCSGITQFPLLDTSAGTNFGYAWKEMGALTSFPLLDTHNGTNFEYAWDSCSGLTSFPLIDTSRALNLCGTWGRCGELTAFPAIRTGACTNFSYAWQSCSKLTAFPLIDTSKGTNFDMAWKVCTAMTDFPLLDFSSGTSFTSAWFSCSSLTPQSTENILVSLNASGKTGLSTDVGGCPKSTWTPAAVAAYDSLVAKGWTITKVD